MATTGAAVTCIAIGCPTRMVLQSYAISGRGPAPLAIHGLGFLLLNGWLHGDNRRCCNLHSDRMSHAHGSPIVRELLAAIETNHVSTQVRGILRSDDAVSRAGRHGESCARVSASKQRVNQRVKHVEPS